MVWFIVCAQSSFPVTAVSASFRSRYRSCDGSDQVLARVMLQAIGDGRRSRIKMRIDQELEMSVIGFFGDSIDIPRAMILASWLMLWWN